MCKPQNSDSVTQQLYAESLKKPTFILSVTFEERARFLKALAGVLTDDAIDHQTLREMHVRLRRATGGNG